MEIRRDGYLQKLTARRHNGMIKVITGVRRCGKSYLLFTLFRRWLLENGVDPAHILEIALDSIASEALRDPLTCWNYIRDAMQDTGMYYLLLDEVQFMPRFEELLNGLARIPNLDVYVTGSNSRFLSTDIVTEFRGRGDEVRVYPLSFSEFQAAYDGPYEDAWEDYICYGGLPQAAQFQDARQKESYLKNMFSAVYLRDVVERNHVQRVDELNTLVDILASSIGSPTNPTRIADTFTSTRRGTYAPATISRHIDYLTDAFLISKADRYDIRGRKYISANLKYYFTDVGLRNARLNFRQQEPTHLMENIIYNELLVRGFSVDFGTIACSEKDADGHQQRRQLEVDFVVNQGSQRFYIQSAYAMPSEEKKNQELRSLRSIPDSFRKLILTSGTARPWRTEEGFVIMSMKYFLLHPDSLEF